MGWNGGSPELTHHSLWDANLLRKQELRIKRKGSEAKRKREAEERAAGPRRQPDSGLGPFDLSPLVGPRVPGHWSWPRRRAISRGPRRAKWPLDSDCLSVGTSRLSTDPGDFRDQFQRETETNHLSHPVPPPRL